MAMNFITASESDLGAGIDQQSAENRIQPGFSEDLVNVDPQAEGYLAKRPGYQGVAGYLPVRVSRIDWNSDAQDNICFTLDSDIDLTGLQGSPLIGYGRLSYNPFDANLPFQAYSSAVPNKGRYFPSFTVDDKKILLQSASSLSISASEHNQAGLFLLKTFLPIGSPITDIESFYLTNYVISQTTSALTLNYGVAQDTEIFASYKSLAAVPGSVAVITRSVVAGVAEVITTAQHGLSSFNILTEFFEDAGGNWTSTEPDSVVIAPNGNVSVTFSQSATIICVLRNVPFSQKRTFTLTAGSNSTTISNIPSHYLDVQVYVDIAGNLEQVIPDSITVDPTTNQATVGWNSQIAYTDAYLFYETVPVLSNKLCATISPAPLTTGSDLSPQLTLWGLKHSEIYNESSPYDKNGWTTHIDSYRAARNNRVVAGLGGNLFAEYQREEVSSDYLLPVLYPNLRARVSAVGAEHILGPAFFGLTEPLPYKQFQSNLVNISTDTIVFNSSHGISTGTKLTLELSAGASLPTAVPALATETVYYAKAISNTEIELYTDPGLGAGFKVNITAAGNGIINLYTTWLRTNPYYRFSGGEEGLATCVSAEWQSGSTVKYVLNTPNRTAPIGTPNLIGQQLTVSQSANPLNSGTFRITGVTQVGSGSSATIEVTVYNPYRPDADADEVGSLMQAGIFTDSIQLTTISPFILGDRILAEAFTEADFITVVESSGTSPYKVTLAGLNELKTLNNTQRIIGKRTGHIIPVRDGQEVATVEDLVRGDMLSITGLNRKVRIRYINTQANDAITISGDTISNIVSTSGFTIGQKILITNAADWSGEWEIVEIINSTSLRIDTELTGSPGAGYSPTLVGHTIEVDEDLEFTDEIDSAVELVVGSRWIPLEAPDDNFTLTPTTYERHLDANPASAQPILKSTMVSDNMYFSNGDDSVMKWDGAALVRAGLPRFQPQLFTAIDSGATAKIILNLVTITDADIEERKDSVIKLIEYASSPLSVGDVIQITGTLGTIKAPIVKIWRNSTTSHDFIQISYNGNLDTDLGAMNTAAASISQTATYKYYFRLNALDNNDNLLASAVTGVDDCVVELSKDSQVRLRLASFPVWDIYDYDKLEIQVYRTKKNGVAPYYLLRTIPLSFDSNRQYVDFVDANSDEVLTTLDPISTALEGAELGTQWSSPLRSKYITSAGNRLVQGNIIADPVIDLQFLAKNLSTATTIQNFDNEIITFRKDDSSTSNISDGENVQRFHLVSSGEQTISSMNFLTMTGRLRIETAATLPALNDWVYLFRNTVNDGANGLCAGWWKVVATGAGWFEVNYITGDFPVRKEFLATSVNTAADTITFATPHGFTSGTRITLDPASGATFPSTTPALLSETFYYVKVINSTDIELHTDSSLGAGSKINITVAGSGTIYVYTVLNCNRWLKATDGRDVPVWLGIDGNINTKSGNTGVIELRATQRLSLAINVQQRNAASPWMLAEAGNSITPAGRIIISQPKVVDTTLGVEVTPGLTTDMQLFANGLKIPRTVEGVLTYAAGAVAYEYPSRILISYPNFPEIFSNPTATVDSESVSVVDVNSADGQEITGIIPFFGESAFGAAQKSGVVVVFKTNSIYLVDIAAKASGINPVQRIESQGLGCTAPHSIANTRDGIMFANESGLYRLGRNLAIEYVGQKIERVWRERVNLSLLDRVFGHHYGTGSQYKVSVPLDGNTSPGDLLVYSHVREYRGGFGAWTRYSDHPAIGWANLFSDAYFATTDGQVMSVRRTGGVSDYRDDSQPISMRALFRAMDFGDAGIRKSVRFLVVKFRVVADTSSTLLYTARDLVENFEQADPFILDDTRNNITGLQDPNRIKIKSIRFSPKEKEAIYFQTLITNEELDQPIEIVEISYRVTGMTDKGMEEAAETK